MNAIEVIDAPTRTLPDTVACRVDACLLDLLRRYLRSEGLAICHARDTQHPIDGLRELEVLREVGSLVRGALAETESEQADLWDEVTADVPDATIAALRKLSVDSGI